MTYYFVDDFNDICRQKDGMDKDFAEVIDLVDLIDDINKLVEENKRLQSINQDYCNYIGDFEDDFIRLAEENKVLRSDRNYWKTLAQSLAKSNGKR